MGFFKEHSYRDGNGVEQKGTDWGGSIVGGMGGAVGITILGIIGLIMAYWVYVVIFVVIALVNLGFLKLYSTNSSENGKKKVISIVLAFYGGCLGLNNFYNKRYITGFIKLVVFSVAFVFLQNTLFYSILIALVIIGWIEAFIYFFGASESKTVKVTSKIIIYTFFILATGISINEYGQWYQRNLIDNLNNITNYDEIRDRVTTKNFQSIYANNYQKSLSVIKGYDKNPISIIFPSLKYAYSIEGLRAYKELYGNDFKIDADDFQGTIERLGKLDKGYSKKLAQLIANYMDKEVVVSFNKMHKENAYFDIEHILKENNQMSALRAYLKLKRAYNLK